jgi:hypothetical protein
MSISAADATAASAASSAAEGVVAVAEALFAGAEAEAEAEAEAAATRTVGRITVLPAEGNMDDSAFESAPMKPSVLGREEMWPPRRSGVLTVPFGEITRRLLSTEISKVAEALARGEGADRLACGDDGRDGTSRKFPAVTAESMLFPRLNGAGWGGALRVLTTTELREGACVVDGESSSMAPFIRSMSSNVTRERLRFIFKGLSRGRTPFIAEGGTGFHGGSGIGGCDIDAASMVVRADLFLLSFDVGTFTGWKASLGSGTVAGGVWTSNAGDLDKRDGC